MYSYGLPLMAEQKQDDQLEHTYSSYVKIRDVVQKTCRRRWTIRKSGERGSAIFVRAARHDDDDDVLTSLWITTIMFDFFIRVHITIFYLAFLIIGSRIVFISLLCLLNRSLYPNICADSLRRLILQCSSPSIILTSSHKGVFFPFSFHIWSAIPYFSPHTIDFQCSSSLTFSGRYVSPWYTLSQLQGMEYTQFLVMLNSVEGLTRKRYLRRAEPLVNILLVSYGLHILQILSARPLT